MCYDILCNFLRQGLVNLSIHATAQANTLHAVRQWQCDLAVHYCRSIYSRLQ